MRLRQAGVGVLVALLLAGCAAGGVRPLAGATPPLQQNKATHVAASTPVTLAPRTPPAPAPSATPAGTASPTPESTLLANALQVAKSRHSFIDVTHRTQLMIYLDPGAAYFGEFSFAAQGAGIFSNLQPATIEVGGPHSIAVSYEGAGMVDRDAKLDFVFGLDMPSGVTEARSLRLAAQLDPLTGAATADLWTAASHYRLVVRPPAHDANQALATVMRAVRSEDWNALYDQLDSLFRAQISRTAYVAQMSNAMSGWQVVEATVVSPITYTDGQSGFFMAAAQVRATLSRHGTTHTDVTQAELLWDNGRWSLFTLGSGPTATPSPSP